jgi:hypothetical protein
MVYNTYYGTGYNNSTLIEPKFEINSYSTQVAHLQFEYIYELDKICLVGQGMGQVKVYILLWRIQTSFGYESKMNMD